VLNEAVDADHRGMRLHADGGDDLAGVRAEERGDFDEAGRRLFVAAGYALLADSRQRLHERPFGGGSCSGRAW
jgi:hypothetical protein